MAISQRLQNAAAVLSGRRKIYYGWWLLAGSVVAMALGSGVSFWAFGLYVHPLEDDFGWSRREVSMGFSIALLASGLSGPLAGRWVDGRGPRSAIIIGAALTTLSYLLLATTNALWQWYVYSAINAVFRQFMFFLPFQALVSRWFDRRRAIALSVLGTGFSLGGFAVVPLMSYLIEATGWRGSFAISGAIIAAVFVPVGLLLVRNQPADIGAFVDGEPPPPERGETRPPQAVSGLALSEVLRTRLFWTLAAAFMLFFFGMFGWLVHQLPFYESEGISRRSATAIVSITAGLGIFARLSVGFLADRIPRFEYAAMTFAAVLLAGMTTLLVSSEEMGIAVFLVFWVTGTGGGPMMEALIVTRAFGVAHFATIIGTVAVVVTAGQIMSPIAAGAIYDATGSYDWALVMFIGTFAAAFVLFALASRIPYPNIEPKIEQITEGQAIAAPALRSR